LKPLKSAAGEGIVAWQGGLAAGGEHCLQKRIDGLATSAVYVAARGRAQLLGITHQLLELPATSTAADAAIATRYAGSVGPLHLSPAQQQQFAKIGNVLARHFNLIGLFGIDAIVNEAGVWTIEVNPRYPASAEVLERATGVSMIGCHVEPCLGQDAHIGERKALVPELGRISSVHGKKILYATKEIKIDRDLRDDFSWLADIPRPETTIPAGAPVATILAAGSSVAHVQCLLTQREKQLKKMLRSRR
jgi:predicted ATP-grasp superfamily ATP-dependent carboligase